MSGVDIIAAELETMPAGPGVYRMLGAKGEALYVGKAKSLKKRVAAYTHPERLPIRLQRMIFETRSLEVVTTHTEAEALLLESNLIKRLAPRYNILLRDDKSFPAILITGDHDWPRIVKHRGQRTRKGEYFGPFASAGAVNQTLTALEKAFLLRSCSDTIFANRTRPCLMHQIKRCSAPCADRISHAEYLAQVDGARAFLSGQSRRIQEDMAARMDEASRALDYEEAALWRDRIRALARIQSHQDINPQGLDEADVVALHQAGGQVSIQVFFFRSGCNYGNRAYFPAHAEDAEASEVMAAFLGQFYADKAPPCLIMTNVEPDEASLIEAALTERAGRKVVLATPKRGENRRLVDHALDNAREALGRRMAESSAQAKLLAGLADMLGLDAPPNRIEVYDNSHIQGANAVGAMIVAGPLGFEKSSYRTFNIKPGDFSPGDDFAMMRQVLTRRFTRQRREATEGGPAILPDLLIIDGGRGQLNAALEVMAELGVEGPEVVAIAKGADRNAGRERLFLDGRDQPIAPEPKDPVLYFLQRLRDEAHRFAIGTHRARRKTGMTGSPLDEVAGIGAARKKALLRHFGSAGDVAAAGLTDLEAVPGISRSLAKKIYDHFHAQG